MLVLFAKDRNMVQVRPSVPIAEGRLPFHVVRAPMKLSLQGEGSREHRVVSRPRMISWMLSAWCNFTSIAVSLTKQVAQR